MKLGEIAEKLGAVLSGGADLDITGVSSLDEAQPGQISFLANKKYASAVAATKASAVIVSDDWQGSAQCAIMKVKSPDRVFTMLAALLAPPAFTYKPGIHKTALIAEDAKIGSGVHIGANTVVESGVVIGDDTVISANCYIGHNTVIGKSCRFYPLVSTREYVRIGDRTIIHNGAVIGSDGFGYYKEGEKWMKIPQLGIVEIGDDVEIGANVTIDRARFGKTVIANGVKLDNLVQIAHNVKVGENTAMAAQSGIAGSAVVGKNVQMAGQSGVAGHVTIGDNVIVAGQSGVTKNIESKQFVIGFPAVPHSVYKKQNALLANLPELREKIHELEKRLSQVEMNDRKG